MIVEIAVDFGLEDTLDLVALEVVVVDPPDQDSIVVVDLDTSVTVGYLAVVAVHVADRGPDLMLVLVAALADP